MATTTRLPRDAESEAGAPTRSRGLPDDIGLGVNQQEAQAHAAVEAFVFACGTGRPSPHGR